MYQVNRKGNEEKEKSDQWSVSVSLSQKLQSEPFSFLFPLF